MFSIIPNGKSSKSSDIATNNIANYINILIATGDDRAQLDELLTNVVEQYAAHWEELGVKLGLKDYQLANISENTAGHQSRQVETCCKRVLQKWLQLDPSPTWGRLDDVIISLTTAPLQLTGHKGIVYTKILETLMYTMLLL